MKLVLLGTTGYHPSNHRHTACLMLPEQGVVLDAGTAMFRVRDYLQTDELDIFLTHAHLDHVIGLTYLLDVLHGREMRRVTIHALADKLAAIDQHLFAPEIFPVKPASEFRPLAARTPVGSGGQVAHFPLVHPGGSVGYRLDWPGHSLAYVTDTTAKLDAPYIEQIRGVDLLVHECYFPDSMADIAELTGHSCLSAVAQVARAADVGRLVLVHVNPLASDDDPLDLAAGQRIFADMQLGRDCLELEF